MSSSSKSGDVVQPFLFGLDSKHTGTFFYREKSFRLLKVLRITKYLTNILNKLYTV